MMCWGNRISIDSPWFVLYHDNRGDSGDFLNFGIMNYSCVSSVRVVLWQITGR